MITKLIIKKLQFLYHAYTLNSKHLVTSISSEAGSRMAMELTVEHHSLSETSIIFNIGETSFAT